MDVYLRATAGFVLPGRAHVILHIAAAKHAAWINIFESGEDFFRRPSRDMRNRIKPPAMAHAHDQFDCAMSACAVKDLVNQRNKRGHALE